MSLRLPEFPSNLMNTTWIVQKREDRRKVVIAIASLRATMAAMCGMHVHTHPQMTSPQIHAVCLKKYFEVHAAMLVKYPDAVAVPYLKYTSLNKAKEIVGLSVYRLSQEIRKILVKQYNVLWQSCVGPDKLPPSGRSWEWVRKRVLVMMYRKLKKNEAPLPANEGSDEHVYCSCSCSTFSFDRCGGRVRVHPGQKPVLGARGATWLAHIHAVWGGRTRAGS